MSLIFPFNNQPANTDYGNTTRSYTCPVGKYARIVATLSSASVETGTTSGGTDAAFTASGTGNSVLVPIWIVSGDVVTATKSGSTARLLVNGNIVSEVDNAEIGTAYVAGGGSTGSAQEQYSEVTFHVEEYNELT